MTARRARHQTHSVRDMVVAALLVVAPVAIAILAGGGPHG